MKHLTTVIYEALSGDSTKLSNDIKKDFKRINNIDIEDAVYYEAALYACTHPGFELADDGKLTPDQLKALQYVLIDGWSKWTCDIEEYPETWTERTYDEGYGSGASYELADEDAADPESVRWSMGSSNSVFEFFWDWDYRKDLHNRKLQNDPKTRKFKTEISKVMKKYGLDWQPKW
jgi:hypothetical protein